MKSLYVAAELLREAIGRKWVGGLLLAMTVIFIILTWVLRFEVVDGAIAMTKFFGSTMGGGDIQSADIALRPIFRFASGCIFFGGLIFGIFICANFATTLLAPGRIDFLLALPIHRWEIVFGSYLGVLALALAMSLYGSMGIMVIMGLKTEVWEPSIVVSACLSAITFASVYAAMLTTAIFTRFTPLIITVGLAVFILGILSTTRHEVGHDIGWEWLGDLVIIILSVFPRIARIAEYAMDIAGGKPYTLIAVLRSLSGILLFAFATLTVGVWRFERKDF